MPHVVLRTRSPLHEVLEGFEPFVERADDTVWRVRDVFLNLDRTHGLVECLVVVRGRLTGFFVHLSQRRKDAAIVVRLHRSSEVETTAAVKRMIALVAEALVDAHPDVAIGETTIRDFLSDRWEPGPPPEPAGWDPLLPEGGLPRPLDWGAVFGDGRPVEVEIGSGKGTFLVEAAESRPETGFVAVEYARSFADYVRDRARRRDLRNVRVVRMDAARFFEDHVEPGSVAVVHLYFPDPWPKERHHKRRLLKPPFVRVAAGALAPGGEIRFVTDHAGYFEEARAFLAAEELLEEAPFPDEETPLTNYLRKYREEGREIHRARFVRR